MIFYSPPCQAFSIAGRQDGFGDPRGTLFFDAFKIIQVKKPKYAIMENVKGLTQKKFKFEFETMLQLLEQEGYKNYWKVLNAKDYGIPQNRERVFILSIREDIEQAFEFPEPFDNGVRLKHLLEENIDEKYFIDDEKAEKLIREFESKFEENAVHPCLTPDRVNKRQNGRRFKNNDDPAFTVNTVDKHGILQIGLCELIFIGGFDSSTDKWIKDGNTFSRNFKEGYRVYDSEGIACTQKSNGGGIGSHTGLYKVRYRIRKLTPLECMRLMGFEDEDYYKLKDKKISNSQIYKMAGNSIVVDVVENILHQLFLNKQPNSVVNLINHRSGG